MKLFVVSLMILAVLSACMRTPPDNIYPPPATETPDLLLTTTPPSPGPGDLTAGTPIPSTSFESRRYLNQAAGFALDYPATWTVNEGVIGDRGSQVQFLSSPEIANMGTVPEGATRVNVTVYEWDPKGDLAAYVANRKGAWDASGFDIIKEEQLMLASGLPGVQLTVQTPDRLVVFLYFAIGDRYLEISGEGNLGLVKEIAYTLRPISK